MSITKPIPRCVGGVILTALAVAGVQSGARSASGIRPQAEANQKVNAAFAALPLSFEPNHGQTNARVRYLARAQGMNVFLTGSETVLALKTSERPKAGSKDARVRRAALHLKTVGGASAPRMSAEGATPGKINYLIGRNPKNWHTGISRYSRVRSQGVYAGIDQVFYGNGKQLEYDFEVAPGADPNTIRVRVDGARAVRVAHDGDLVMETAAGTLRQQKPVIYQEANGKREAVAGSYRMLAKNEIGFQVAAYDRSRTLVIDPVLVWSTYIGGTGVDQSNCIAVDENSNAYIAGSTSSPDFPVEAGAYQTDFGGGTPQLDLPRSQDILPWEAPLSPESETDIFVAKFKTDGSGLEYCTYVGGTGNDVAYGIAISPARTQTDPTWNAYITGYTTSFDFPVHALPDLTVPHATYSGGVREAYITELTDDGSGLIYSTFMGPDYNVKNKGIQVAHGIAVDDAGNAYICGYSTNDLPTANAWQPKFGGGITDAFVAGVDSECNLQFCTFLGGGPDNYSGDTNYGPGNEALYGIALDPQGYLYVTGCTSTMLNFPATGVAWQRINASRHGKYFDGIVAKYIPGGKQQVYCTFLGGSNDECGLAIAADAAGNAYVTGVTRSPGNSFPTQGNCLQGTSRGGDDAFVTKYDAIGFMRWSTYLGGQNDDQGRAIATDANGNVYITGRTVSRDFPYAKPLKNAISGFGDIFVVKLPTNGLPLVYSTYFGTNDQDMANGIAVDQYGDVYVTGYTNATTFPTTVGSFQPTFGGGDRDAFLLKITDDTVVPTKKGKISAPNIVKFGTVPLFTTMTKFLDIKNTGKGDLVGTVGTLSAPYSVAAGGGIFSIAPGKKLRVILHYVADSPVTQTAKLLITSNDPKNPNFIVKLTGKGKNEGH